MVTAGRHLCEAGQRSQPQQHEAMEHHHACRASLLGASQSLADENYTDDQVKTLLRRVTGRPPRCAFSSRDLKLRQLRRVVSVQQRM